MINLLPPEEKYNLQQEEQYKLILILGLLGLFFLISLSLILLSLKIYIATQAESQKILAQIAQEQYQSSQYQNLEIKIDLANKNLADLNYFYQNQSDLVSLLEEISAAVPEETYLTSLFINPLSKGKKQFQVSLNGFCADRESLLNFKKKLEIEPDFHDVYFPPSSWLKSEDIDFSTTFEVSL